jgi:phage terminase small subunit
MNVKVKKQLTEMQHQFVVNYIRNGFNLKQAALDAGYSKSFAHVGSYKLISHPIIKERIEKAYRIVEATQDRTLCMTLQEKARVLSQIIYDIVPQDGSQPKRSQYKDAINAIKELNHMSGDYAPDKRLNLTVNATKDKLLEAKRQYEEF